METAYENRIPYIVA